jgi:hydrogenase maturation protease
VKREILILCCGYPYETDKALGYRVSKILENMKLPENVEMMEVGESACMIPSVIAGKDKVVIVDVFQTKDSPGTVVRLKPQEVPVKVNGLTDIPKFHLMETLDQLAVIGDRPEVVFVGVVPKDIATFGDQLTPVVESKMQEVVDLVMKEIL